MAIRSICRHTNINWFSQTHAEKTNKIINFRTFVACPIFFVTIHTRLLKERILSPWLISNKHLTKTSSKVDISRPFVETRDHLGMLKFDERISPP